MGRATMLFVQVIKDHRLKKHLTTDTGPHDWKHLAAIVMAFHTSSWCVGMHFVTVPCGEVMVATLMNAVSPALSCAVYLGATAWYLSLDAVGGLATGLGLALSMRISLGLHEWATVSLGLGGGTATTLIALATFAGSFGTTPISHGFFEQGVEDDLTMEPMSNLLSKALIPFNTKLELLHWLRLYSNLPLWRDLDTMAAEMHERRTRKPYPHYPKHTASCLFTR